MKKREQQYQRILTRNRSGWDFASPAQELINKHSHDINETFLSVTAHVTAPVLVSYVLWVLRDAQRQGIKSLLFVARDGLVMCRIAEILCAAWDMGIECRYFYASRYSLRLPMFAVDRAYALDKLCDPDSGNATAVAVLAAAGLSREQSEGVLQELHMIPDKRLTPPELANLKTQLDESRLFEKLATKVATSALEATKGYFLQNVPSIPESFALVDSGWSGSIQTSFGKLYKEIYGHKPSTLQGYYFGMLAVPPEHTGKYRGYYFSPGKNLVRFSRFCIDLFECLCAANHGRVLGYELGSNTNKWLPIFDNEVTTPGIVWDADKQIELCAKYAKNFVKHNKQKPDNLPNIKLVETLLRAFINKPTKKEAQIYGEIPFSRGVIEGDVGTLARKMNAEDWRHYSLFHRILGKLKRRNPPPANPIFWFQGTLALSEASMFRKLGIQMLMAAYWLKIRVR